MELFKNFCVTASEFVDPHVARCFLTETIQCYTALDATIPMISMHALFKVCFLQMNSCHE